MTTIEQIEQQIAALQKQVEELKAAQAVEKPWPQNGDQAWYVNLSGDLCSARFGAENVYQKGMREIGNVFRTKEDAEREGHARRVVVALKRQPGASGFVGFGNSWIICCEDDMEELSAVRSRYAGHPVYYESKQYAESAIAAVGEAEIIKAWWWISGVKE